MFHVQNEHSPFSKIFKKQTKRAQAIFNISNKNKTHTRLFYTQAERTRFEAILNYKIHPIAHRTAGTVEYTVKH